MTLPEVQHANGRPTEIPRDRWQRPLIIPPEGGKPVSYRRPSKYSKVVDDDTMITKWKLRVAALGLAQRPDLQAKVAGVLAAYADPLDHPEAKRTLNAALEEAHVAGGGNVAAERGTWWHTLSEYVDQGDPLPGEATQYEEQRLGEYAAELAANGVEILAIEQFVVHDGYRAAGTFDRLVRHEGKVRVLDLKTGTHDPAYPMGVAGQLAIYNGGSYYDPGTGVRSPIHPEMDHKWGLMVHLPSKGEGCRLYRINLVAGREIADEAKRIYETRSKFKASALCIPV